VKKRKKRKKAPTKTCNSNSNNNKNNENNRSKSTSNMASPPISPRLTNHGVKKIHTAVSDWMGGDDSLKHSLPELAPEEAELLIFLWKKHAKDKKVIRSKEAFLKIVTEAARSSRNPQLRRLAGPDPMAEWLFDFFDKNKDGRIKIDELVSGVVIICTGTTEQKADLTFRLYDLDNNGSVSRKEMLRRISLVFNAARRVLKEKRNDSELNLMAWQRGKEELTYKAAERLVERTFKLADTNKDGRLTHDEWIEFARTHIANSDQHVLLHPGGPAAAVLRQRRQKEQAQTQDGKHTLAPSGTDTSLRDRLRLKREARKAKRERRLNRPQSAIPRLGELRPMALSDPQPSGAVVGSERLSNTLMLLRQRTQKALDAQAPGEGNVQTKSNSASASTGDDSKAAGKGDKGDRNRLSLYKPRRKKSTSSESPASGNERVTATNSRDRPTTPRGRQSAHAANTQASATPTSETPSKQEKLTALKEYQMHSWSLGQSCPVFTVATPTTTPTAQAAHASAARPAQNAEQRPVGALPAPISASALPQPSQRTSTDTDTDTDIAPQPIATATAVPARLLTESPPAVAAPPTTESPPVEDEDMPPPKKKLTGSAIARLEDFLEATNAKVPSDAILKGQHSADEDEEEEDSDEDSDKEEATDRDSDKEEKSCSSDEQQKDAVALDIARRGKELAELSNWLLMAIKRRNAKNSNKLADFLRQKAFPFLDEFGAHPDALPHILRMYVCSFSLWFSCLFGFGFPLFILLLFDMIVFLPFDIFHFTLRHDFRHEALEMYDREVQGAVEKLGLNSSTLDMRALVRKSQTPGGDASNGEGANTTGTKARGKLSEEDSESEEYTSDEYSDYEDDDDDDDDGGFGFGSGQQLDMNAI